MSMMQRMSQVGGSRWSSAVGVLLAGVAGLVSSPSVGAGLIAYEGFDPAESTVNVVGTASGTGFAGPWADSVGPGRIHRVGNNDGFVAFPKNVYFKAPAGGRARHETWYDHKAVVRPLSTAVDLDADGEVYLSFLLHDNGENRDHDARVFLGRAADPGAEDPGLRFYFGMAYTKDMGIAARNATEVAWGWNNSFGQAFGTATPTAVGPQRLYFIVARIRTSQWDFDTFEMRAYLYTPGDDTTVDTTPDEVTWDVTFSGMFSGPLNELGLFLAGLGFPEVDEIRVGTTWADVVNTTAPQTPSILGQPQSQTRAQGGVATFTVQAVGAGPLTYRWQKQGGEAWADLADGGNVAGASTASLTVSPLALTDAGSYRVVVSSGGSNLPSEVATLTVVGDPATDVHLHAGMVVNGTVGFHYRVEYRTALDPADAWQLLQDIPALGASPLTVFDPAPAEQPKRFYRAVIVP